MRPDRLLAMPEKSTSMRRKKKQSNSHKGKRTITPEQFSPRAEICIDLYIDFVSIILLGSKEELKCCVPLLWALSALSYRRPHKTMWGKMCHGFSFSVLSRWVVGSFTSRVGDFPSTAGVSSLLYKIHQFPDTCHFTLPVPQWQFATPWIVSPGPS